MSWFPLSPLNLPLDLSPLASPRRRRFKSVEDRNPNIYFVRPGEVLFVVDENNLAHFRAGPRATSIQPLGAVREDANLPLKARELASTAIEAYKTARHEMEHQKFEVLIEDPPARERGKRRNDEHKSSPARRVHQSLTFPMVLHHFNPNGNAKGEYSHTIGPTRTSMSNFGFHGPSALWERGWKSLHTDEAEGTRLVSKLKEFAARQLELDGKLSAALFQLWTVPTEYKVLEARGESVSVVLFPSPART